MQSDFDRHVLEQIASVELSPDEVRAVLERLGQEEFGLDGTTTVRDVVEATGADPTDIAAALQAVRGANLAHVYGRRLDDHEHRITRLEGSEVSPIDRPGNLERKTEAMLGLLKMQEVESLRRQKEGFAYLITLVVIAALVILMIVAWYATSGRA